MVSDLDRWVAILARGGVVACPTETFYGLLADATNAEAVERVVHIKGRSADAPIAVLLPDAGAVEAVAAPLSPAGRRLAARFWPGPLTLVAVARAGLPAPLVRGGTIGMRVPGPSIAADLVRAFGRPLTATSANRSGQPAAVRASQVEAALGAAVDAVVPGQTPGGAPSTVVDLTTEPFRVLRRGAVDPTPGDLAVLPGEG